MKVSVSWCFLNEVPGALIERSWKGGRPGIVAGIQSVLKVKANARLGPHTRIHGKFLNCCHGPNL